MPAISKYGMIATMILVMAPFLPAFGQAPGCADSEKSHQFDFWIGEWTVTSEGKVVGHNAIKPILGGCVLQETWKGLDGTAGSSFNYYNPQTKQWHQYWVWQNGTPLPLLTGEFKEGRMALVGESVDAKGQAVKLRITWTDNEDGTVRQKGEQSSDAGKSWQPLFDGLYTKT